MFVCLSKLSSRILRMVDPSIIHDWKGLFVLMCNVKNPIDFYPRNGDFYPKNYFLTYEGIKKRREEERNSVTKEDKITIF